MTGAGPTEPRHHLRLRDQLRTRRQNHYADYDAFLSYSRIDEDFATNLQRGLERLMKPWNRVRSLKVFRDISSLAPEPGLWRSIERALNRSSWLILLLSPEAAASRWVNRELEWWLGNRSTEHLLIVVTAGVVAWDPDTNDFHATAATAVPPALRGSFPEEPSWVDATWSRDARADDQRLHDAAAGLASTIKQIPKDEVFARNVREHRRTMRLARLGMVALALLLVAATVGGVIAYLQRNTARAQATLALSRQLAAVASSEMSSNLDVSLILAAESFRRDPNPQSTAALLTAALASPHLVRFVALPARVTTFAGSGDGRVVVAGLADGRVMRWAAGSSRARQVAKLPAEVTEVGVNADGKTVVATDGSILSERSTAVLIRNGEQPRRLAVPDGQTASAVGISPSGRTVLVFGDAPAGGGARSVSLFDGRTGAVDDVREATSSAAGVRFIVPSDDEVVLFDPGFGAWDRRAVATWKTMDSGGVGFGTHQSAGDPSADGEFMTATNGAPTIPVWRMRGTASNDRPSRVGVAPITAAGPLALSPDGKRLAVSGTGTIYVVDTTKPGAARSTPIVLEGIGNVDAVRFVGGDSRLVSSSGAKLVLWDVAQHDRLARTARIPIGSGCGACSGPRATPSPDGKSVAVVDGSGSSGAVIDLEARQSRPLPDAELDFAYEPPLWPPGGVPTFPVVPPAGGSEASPPPGLPAGTRSWRAGEAANRIVASGVTRDGRSAVVVDEHGKVLVQRIVDGAITRRISTHPDLELGSDSLEAAAVAPGGERVATLLDDRVSLVDIPTGRTVLRFAAKGATYIAFGGERLFVQMDDGTLQVRRGEALRMERTLPGDPSYSWPPVPNPTGTLVARQRRNHRIALVDAGSGSTLAVIPTTTASGAEKVGVTFSLDGRRLITVTEESSYGAGAVLVDRDLSTSALMRSACRTAGAELSGSQWRRFVGIDPPPRPACARSDG